MRYLGRQIIGFSNLRRVQYSVEFKYHVFMNKSRSKQTIAAEVWRLMSEFSMAQFRQKALTAQGMGLTPGHMKALFVLEPGEGRPIGACAQELGCDASTATWLVDRLEEKGLVERRAQSTDRRVKAVALTEQGEELRGKLAKRYHEPPPALLELDEATLHKLETTFAKLLEKWGPLVEQAPQDAPKALSHTTASQG
jgi:DNA-binding MarR family transcriptional regulator